MGVPETNDVRPPAPTGSWRAALVLSGALGLWLVVSRFLPSVFVGGADLTMLGALPLLGALGYVVMSRLVRIASPGARARERRAVVLLLCAAVLVPLGFAATPSPRDAALPAPVRVQGALPNVAALLGKSDEEVERALGAAYGREQEYASDSIEVHPWESATARVVAYPLGDREGWWTRDPNVPAMGGASALWQGPSPTSYGTDNGATMTVYYSFEGRALGARLTLSPIAAAGTRGADWSERFLRACGLAGGLVRADPPAWATASREATDGITFDEWGLVRDVSGWIGYSLRIAGPPAANVASGTTPAARPDEPGVLVLTLGPTLVDKLPVSGGSAGTGVTTVGSGAATGPPPAAEATSTFAERTFWAVVFEAGTSEAAVLGRAEGLNKRASSSDDASPAVAVERSGHLHGLAQGDYWVIISCVGFESEQDAARSAALLSLRLGIVQDVVSVTKRCGDVTIRRIQPEAIAP